jgi:hypothetical protein
MTPLELAATAAGSVLAVGAAGGVLLRAERRARRIANGLLGDGQQPGILTHLRLLDDRTAAIEAQMHPNSGHSLRDAVNGLDAQLHDAARRQDETRDMLVRHLAAPHPRR